MARHAVFPSPPSPPSPVRLGVVVPARNEQAHIGGCLAALDLAGRVALLPLEIVVVLDSCDDDTEEAVRSVAEELAARLQVIVIDARRVGAARRVGVARLLAGGGGRTGWIATTDADSVVPPDWFLRQLDHRARGAGLVVGTVHVDDWLDRIRLRRHWEHAYRADAIWGAAGHHHVHGANLAFDAGAYVRSGGFADVAHDEDVRLVGAFQDTGEHVAWATDLSVATSARRLGRAPLGFASHLNQLARAVEAPTPTLEVS